MTEPMEIYSMFMFPTFCVEIAEEPVSWPWNGRGIVVRDRDGYRMVFFAPVDVSRSFEDVMGDVSEGGEVFRHD